MLFLLQSVKHCMKVLSGPNVSLVEGFVGNNRIAVIFSWFEAVNAAFF